MLFDCSGSRVVIDREKIEANSPEEAYLAYEEKYGHPPQEIDGMPAADACPDLGRKRYTLRLLARAAVVVARRVVEEMQLPTREDAIAAIRNKAELPALEWASWGQLGVYSQADLDALIDAAVRESVAADPNLGMTDSAIAAEGGGGSAPGQNVEGRPAPDADVVRSEDHADRHDQVAPPGGAPGSQL